MLIFFKAIWRIGENDLIAMNDTVNRCLVSTYVTTASGIQYRLQIYPNGNRKENFGKVFVFLVVKIGIFKEVGAKWVLETESAKHYSQEIEHTFKKSHGWGKRYCDTAELFDAQKGFIRDGKLELKVIGIFEYCEVGFFVPMRTLKLGDDLWANEESKDFKIIVNGKIIMAHKLVLATMSPVFDEMFKTKSKEALENQLVISDFSFRIVEWAIKEIYGCNFTMQNYNGVNDTKTFIQFYEKFNISFLKDRYTNLLLRLVTRIPNLYEVYNADNSVCIIDRKYYGTSDLGDKLWASEETKDFTLIGDGKEIMVHKLVLASRSPTFAAEFRSETKENSKIGLDFSNDYSFNIVEMAMKTIYQDETEGVLISYICTVNVCVLVNCAINTNSTKLQERCMDFIMSAFASNTPLGYIDKLYKNVALKIVQRSGYRIVDKYAALKLLEESTYQYVYTQKENASSVIMPVLK